jgi:hypothetical protein
MKEWSVNPYISIPTKSDVNVIYCDEKGRLVIRVKMVPHNKYGEN